MKFKKRDLNDCCDSTLTSIIIITIFNKIIIWQSATAGRKDDEIDTQKRVFHRVSQYQNNDDDKKSACGFQPKIYTIFVLHFWIRDLLTATALIFFNPIW